MRARKVLVRPGVFTAPIAAKDGTRVRGEVNITPDRVKRWAEQFRAMKAAGIRVPVCWGHDPHALPGEGLDRAAKQAAVAQANAGYLEEMSLDPDDGLAGILDVPGATVEGDSLVTEQTLPDGRRVKAAIKEVSVAIRDWTDGSGRKWEDAIVHVALVTHPVMGGQEGFESAELATGGVDSRLYERQVAGGGRRLLILMGTEEQTMPDMTAPVTTGTQSSPRTARALQVLASFGLHLPEDTHEGNIEERIDLCGNAILKDRATRGDAGDGMDDDMGDEFDDGLGDEDMLDDGGEVEMEGEGADDFDDDGVPDEGAGDDEEMIDDTGAGVEDDDDTDEVSGDSDDMPEEAEDEDEDAEEEPRPMLMSTDEGTTPRKPARGKTQPAKVATPLERALAAEMAKSVQEKRKARLARLVTQGLPRDKAQELFGKIDRSKVRLQRKGAKVTPVEEVVDIELATIEGVFASGVVAPPQKAKRARRPDVAARNLEDDPEMQKAIREAAASVSRDMRL